MQMVSFVILMLGREIMSMLFFNLLGEKSAYTKAGKEESNSSNLIVKVLE